MRRVKDRAALDAGLMVSPGEIIARAAATVPAQAEGEPANDGRRAWAAPPMRDDGPRVVVLAPPAPMRRAQRRPRDMLRQLWFYVSRGALALALFGALVGAPVWLIGSGTLDDAGRQAADVYQVWRREGGLGAAVRLENLSVEGRNRTTLAALRGALQIKKGDSLLAADPWQIKRRLEALPWVRVATVERRFPGTVIVTLTERVPIARFRDRGATILVDETGALIRVAAEKEHENLILLAGDGAPEAATALLKLLESDPALARRIVSATRHGQRRWDLAFDSGAVLRLPDGYERAALAKFGEFERQHNLLARGAVTYDMRLPDRLVIRSSRAAAPATAPAPPEKPSAAKKPRKAG
jgi:cell division protein FtsQ